MKFYSFVAVSLSVLMFITPAVAELNPTRESLSGVYPGKAYSPYAQRAYASTPLWGDTHLHTGLSVDAGLFGARLGLEEAYQFARGEEVVSSTGQPVKLSRPLDWLVIADHSDAMGFFQDLAAGEPGILKFEEGQRWYDGLQQGAAVEMPGIHEAIASGSKLLTMLVDGREIKARLEVSERHREILLAGGLLNWARIGS